MEKVIDGKTVREFLEWLYEVIRDDEIDYMWDICGRIGELKAKESVDKIKVSRNGCGRSLPLYPGNKDLDRIYFTCGDNKFYSEEDKPNLCKDCRKMYLKLVNEHRKNWNPNYNNNALTKVNEEVKK